MSPTTLPPLGQPSDVLDLDAIELCRVLDHFDFGPPTLPADASSSVVHLGDGWVATMPPLDSGADVSGPHPRHAHDRRFLPANHRSHRLLRSIMAHRKGRLFVAGLVTAGALVVVGRDLLAAEAVEPAPSTSVVSVVQHDALAPLPTDWRSMLGAVALTPADAQAAASGAPLVATGAVSLEVRAFTEVDAEQYLAALESVVAEPAAEVADGVPPATVAAPPVGAIDQPLVITR